MGLSALWLAAACTNRVGFGEGEGTSPRPDANETTSAALVSFAETSSNILEGDSGVELALVLDREVLVPVRVTLTLSGSATEGADFTVAAREVTIPAGARQVALGLAILDDDVAEGPESIVCTLTSVLSGPARLGVDIEHAATLIDDETVSLFVDDVQVVEGGVAEVVVRLSRVAPTDVLAQWATVAGVPGQGERAATLDADVVSATGQLTIAAGATTASIFVTTVDTPAVCELDEVLAVELSSVVGAPVVDGTAQVRIGDDDLPRFTITGPTTADEGATFTITAALDAACPTHLVSFAYATQPDEAEEVGGEADYVATSGVFELPPGVASGQLVVPTIEDAAYEHEEAFKLRFSAPSYATVALNELELKIEDDDALPAVAFDVASASVSESQGLARLIVRVTGERRVPGRFGLTLGGATVNGVDLDLRPLSGTHAVPTTPTTYTVAFDVPLVDDDFVEGPETLQLGLINLVDLAVGEAPAHVLTVDDDDGVVSVAAGRYHTCVVRPWNDVACWGADFTGQLGRGGSNRGDGANEMGAGLPTHDFGGGALALGLAAGDRFTCGLSRFAPADPSSNQVRCWGYNGSHRAGGAEVTERVGNVVGYSSAQALATLDDVQLPWVPAAVAVGRAHACATDGSLGASGSILCWGDGSRGQTGRGVNQPTLPSTNPSASVPVGQNEMAVELALGADFSCARMNAGNNGGAAGSRVRCWGAGDRGQLGRGATDDRGDAPGELSGVSQVPLPGLYFAQSLVSGGAHVCALLTDLEGWYGADGLHCWGANESGQLGLGNADDRGDAPDEMGDFLPSVSLGVGTGPGALVPRQIAAGRAHTCAVVTDPSEAPPNDRHLKCWGANNAGQLGLGDTTPRGGQSSTMPSNLPYVDLGAGFVPDRVFAGGDTTCVLSVSGRFACWGDNRYGQLGQGDVEARGDQAGEMGISLAGVAVPLTLGTLTGASVGSEHVCVVGDGGSSTCWGRNTHGQLGFSDGALGDALGEMASLAAVPVPSTTGVVVAVSVSAVHSCALTAGGGIYCWGSNTTGALGTAATLPVGDRAGSLASLQRVDLGGVSALAVHAWSDDFDRASTCAILASGRVRCWGWNSGAIADAPIDVIAQPGAGNADIALGTTTSGSALFATSLTMGDRHVCAQLGVAGVKCWGSNNGSVAGALGLGDTIARRANAPGEMGDNLPFVSLGNIGTSALSRGHAAGHHCAAASTGGLKCWGQNASGQLGLGDTQARGDEPSEMGTALATVPFEQGARVYKVATGESFSCAAYLGATGQSRAQCWGAGLEGQLATGTAVVLGDQPGEVGLGIAPIEMAGAIRSLVAGPHHACLVTTTNELYCWGANEYGQLGLDATDHQGDEPGELSDAWVPVNFFGPTG